jgi:uncharacterized protein
VKISVKVKPNSRLLVVKKIDDALYSVSLTARPVDGKANEQLVEVLAEYFGKPKRCITILRGETSKLKVVEIL